VASPDINTSAGTLQLSEVLSLAVATPLAKALTERRGTDVVIDASHVRHLGAQCLQVLLSAASTWSAEGASLRICNRSTGFLLGLQLVGLPASTFAE
jgi:chemotaxis protein CheX